MLVPLGGGVGGAYQPGVFVLRRQRRGPSRSVAAGGGAGGGEDLADGFQESTQCMIEAERGKAKAQSSQRMIRLKHLTNELRKLVLLQKHFERTTGHSDRVRLLREELDLQRTKVKDLANDVL